MAVYRYVNIQLPEAKRLADLAGISEDLHACLVYCEKFLAGYPNHPDLESFSAMVVMKYARCFSNGVRKATQDELIAIASVKDAPTHELILGIRDRHVAHSVSDLEHHAVRVWLNPEEKGRAVNNVNIESERLLTIGNELYPLRELAAHLSKWVQVEMRAEEKKLTELVKCRYSLEQLYSTSASSNSPNSYDNLRSRKGRPGP